MKSFLLAIFLGLSSHASDKPKVIVIDEDMDPTPLEKNFEVERKVEFSSLPDKKTRDEFLEKYPEAQKLDEFQKDKFYMDKQKERK